MQGCHGVAKSSPSRRLGVQAPRRGRRRGTTRCGQLGGRPGHRGVRGVVEASEASAGRAPVESEEGDKA